MEIKSNEEIKHNKPNVENKSKMKYSKEFIILITKLFEINKHPMVKIKINSLTKLEKFSTINKLLKTTTSVSELLSINNKVKNKESIDNKDISSIKELYLYFIELLIETPNTRRNKVIVTTYISGKKTFIWLSNRVLKFNILFNYK